jgi:hypothetical protein
MHYYYYYEISQNLYAWKVIKKPDTPAPVDFTIKLGTATFGTTVEDGSENTMGEWLSRKIGQIMPAFEDCQIVGVTITHPKEPVELWIGEPPLPTIREREHVGQFDVAGRMCSSKHVSCTYPYDPDESMRFGHMLANQIPDNPACADSPAQPWPTSLFISLPFYPAGPTRVNVYLYISLPFLEPFPPDR